MRKDFLIRLKLAIVPSLENNWRPEMLSGRFLLYCFIAIFVLKIFTLPLLFSLQQNVFFADITKTTILNLINAERKAVGLPILKTNPSLDKAAMLKAKDMMAKDYFSHQSPDGLSPWHWFQAAGYKYNVAGENLAIGFIDSDEVHRAWMDSSGHKANILNQNFQETGIAIIQGEFNGNNTTIVVNLFGKPLASAAAPQQSGLKNQPENAIIPPATTATKEVVSGAIEDLQKEGIKKEDASITFNILSFISAHYYDLIQKVIYLILTLIIIALLINIFVRIDIQYPDLILKATGFIIVLLIFSAIDKITLINLVPHGFGIN